MSDDVKTRNATEVTDFNLYTSDPAAADSAFEDWYVVNAFDYVANPIGSRECGLQRKAWHAGHAAALLAQHEEIALTAKELARITTERDSCRTQLAEANECERGNFIRAEENLRLAESLRALLASANAEVARLKAVNASLNSTIDWLRSEEYK